MGASDSISVEHWRKNGYYVILQGRNIVGRYKSKKAAIDAAYRCKISIDLGEMRRGQ